jgi:hypothetical protein
MRTISAVLGGLVIVVVSVAACGSNSSQPANSPASSAQPYGQQGYPTAQPSYPPPGQPGYPPPGQPTAAPTGTAPAGSGQLAVPGPAALPCQNDSSCLTHRCNTQYGKCAFPCATDADCIQGSTCFTGGGAMASCIPKPPGT